MSATVTGSVAALAADEGGTSAWLGWLLVAVVLGAVAAVPLVLRGRRHTAWRRQLSAAEGELGWLSHQLLPGLRHAHSREEVAGGWAVASPRVVAAEDRLTALESTAYEDAGREHARALRDAARLARHGMQELVAPGGNATWAFDLDEVIADLGAALGARRATV